MACPTNLQQVGTEAFCLLDEIEEQNEQILTPQAHYNRYRPRSNLTCVYSPKETVIDSFQAAYKYNGMMICEYQVKKPPSYAYPPSVHDGTVDSFQAAYRYNGRMIFEQQENNAPMTTMRKVHNYRNYWSSM